MPKIEKVLYIGRTHTTAARREGTARAERVDIRTSASGSGTKQEQSFEAALPHPTAEQLFAGAWSACYSSALMAAAQEMKVALPPDVAVDVEIDVGTIGAEYFIQARFNVTVPGAERALAEALAHRGHEICPYSKATHGNIDVAVEITV